MQPVIVLPNVRACVRWSAIIKVQYTLNCLCLWRLNCRVQRVCALFQGLTEFCFVFRFVFLCATLLSGYTFATTT